MESKLKRKVNTLEHQSQEDIVSILKLLKKDLSIFNCNKLEIKNLSNFYYFSNHKLKIIKNYLVEEIKF